MRDACRRAPPGHMLRIPRCRAPRSVPPRPPSGLHGRERLSSGRRPYTSREPQPEGPGRRGRSSRLPAGSSCAIAAEYLRAASANWPLLNSSLPWLFKPAGPSVAAGTGAAAAAGSPAPRPLPGCWLALPAASGARGRPRLSAPDPGARPRRGAPLSGRLPPSLLRVSFFWMLPMARGSAALPAPAGSAASVGSGCGKRVFASSGETTYRGGRGGARRRRAAQRARGRVAAEAGRAPPPRAGQRGSRHLQARVCRGADRRAARCPGHAREAPVVNSLNADGLGTRARLLKIIP